MPKPPKNLSQLFAQQMESGPKMPGLPRQETAKKQPQIPKPDAAAKPKPEISPQELLQSQAQQGLLNADKQNEQRVADGTKNDPGIKWGSFDIVRGLINLGIPLDQEPHQEHSFKPPKADDSFQKTEERPRTETPQGTGGDALQHLGVLPKPEQQPGPSAGPGLDPGPQRRPGRGSNEIENMFAPRQ